MIGGSVTSLHAAILPDGRTVDVDIDGGVVVGVRTALAAPPSPPLRPPADDALDLTGWQLLPAAVEPHAHLDKAFSWPHVRQQYGDLLAAIDAWREFDGTMTADDVESRARLALHEYVSHGISAVRTHVDVLPGPDPLRSVEAVLALREEFRDVVHVEVAILGRSGECGSAMRDAVSLGVDVIGGCPHLTPDPVAETRWLLDLAEDAGLPVDLHTDEQLNPRVLTVLALAAEVRQRGLGGRVTASHCVSLGLLPAPAQADAAAAIAAAGLRVVSLPITNLYLQGRSAPTATPRGITALRALLAAGVDVAAGGDNLRDPFNPMGRGDPFETTSLLITAGHLDAGEALTAVTDAGRRVLNLPPAGVVVGARPALVAGGAPPRGGGPARRGRRPRRSGRRARPHRRGRPRRSGRRPHGLRRRTPRQPDRRHSRIPARPDGDRMRGDTMTTTMAVDDATATATRHPLSFQHVGKVFDTGVVALEDVTLDIGEQELVGVVGPSGCGKSTLLRLASGLSSPTAGEIRVESRELAYVFQDATLLPWRSALANVALVGELRGDSKAERRAKACEALNVVGLGGFEDKLPAQLSGGMRMRVSLARALVAEPDLFLFDEPFGALDEITRLRLQDELLRLLAHRQSAGLFITHSVSEAVYLCHRVVVMSGRPGRVLTDVAVDLPFPRSPDVRYSAEFGRIAGAVSAALAEGHR